jgi:hypothetical protein
MSNSNSDTTDSSGGSYADPDEPACKYCGQPVETIPTEGPSYLNCEQHGKLNVSEVLGIEPGEFRVGEKP